MPDGRALRMWTLARCDCFHCSSRKGCQSRYRARASHHEPVSMSDDERTGSVPSRRSVRQNDRRPLRLTRSIRAPVDATRSARRRRSFSSRSSEGSVRIVRSTSRTSRRSGIHGGTEEEDELQPVRFGQYRAGIARQRRERRLQDGRRESHPGFDGTARPWHPIRGCLLRARAGAAPSRGPTTPSPARRCRDARCGGPRRGGRRSRPGRVAQHAANDGPWKISSTTVAGSADSPRRVDTRTRSGRIITIASPPTRKSWFSAKIGISRIRSPRGAPSRCRRRCADARRWQQVRRADEARDEGRPGES